MMNNQSGRMKLLKNLAIILALAGIAFLLSLTGPGGGLPAHTPLPETAHQRVLPPGGKSAVYAYLAEHGELPDYYMTKDQARKLGWQGGGLEPYAPGKMIGGDRFGNYEGLLPDKKGRVWKEADIGSMGQSDRGAERMVFSDDGLIYYTQDHYASFEPLKGEE